MQEPLETTTNLRFLLVFTGFYPQLPGAAPCWAVDTCGWMLGGCALAISDLAQSVESTQDDRMVNEMQIILNGNMMNWREKQYCDHCRKKMSAQASSNLKDIEPSTF